MTVDGRLIFRPYIARVRGEVLRRTNIMRAIARTVGGPSDRVLRKFYMQAVLSCINYGAPCLITTAQNAALSRDAGRPTLDKNRVIVGRGTHLQRGGKGYSAVYWAPGDATQKRGGEAVTRLCEPGPPVGPRNIS